MGWCEAAEHDLDDDRSEGDLYAGISEYGVKYMVFLCEEHKP